MKRVLLAALLLMIGCGSGENGAVDGGVYRAGDGGVYRGPGVALRVPPPTDAWKRIQVPKSNLAFEVHGNGVAGTVTVNVRCSKDVSRAPLDSLTEQFFDGYTERNTLLGE